VNEDDLTSNLKWLVDDLFGYLTERNRTGIVAIWNGAHSQCWTTIGGHQLYDVMDDIGKRLSQMPPRMPELTEGHHLIKSGDAADEMGLELALKIPPNFQSIVVVFSDNDDPSGDSVFCIGSPLELTFLCVRSCSCAEAANGGPFVNFIPPTGSN
jgi:hypothetical protein